MVQISVLAHNVKGKDQKKRKKQKGLRRKVLGFVMVFIGGFVQEWDFTYA